MKSGARKHGGGRRFFRHYGLTVALVALFLATYGWGQVATGWKTHNKDRVREGERGLSLGEYLRSAHFVEATTENWESEFFQMFIYVWLTTFLYQKGSAESNDPDRPQEKRPVTAQSPWPVRRGGVWLRLYRHSLSGTLAALFLISFWLHLCSSARLENEERLRRGEAPLSAMETLGDSNFWFESFQNWQSEFLAILCMVVLTIHLREANSPESKDVEAPHDETG